MQTLMLYICKYIHIYINIYYMYIQKDKQCALPVVTNSPMTSL